MKPPGQSLDQIEQYARRCSTDVEALEHLAKLCRVYTGKPGADVRRAERIHVTIQEMLRKCQKATHLEIPVTMPSTPSGLPKEVQVVSSSN